MQYDPGQRNQHLLWFIMLGQKGVLNTVRKGKLSPILSLLIAFCRYKLYRVEYNNHKHRKLQIVGVKIWPDDNRNHFWPFGVRNIRCLVGFNDELDRWRSHYKWRRIRTNHRLFRANKKFASSVIIQKLRTTQSDVNSLTHIST